MAITKLTFFTVIMTSTLILQWNIRGLNHNYSSGLNPLLITHNPDIISLQETKLPNNDFQIKNYQPYHHINQKSLIAAGGTSLFIKNNLPQKEIKINSNLQVIAARVTAFKPITICSVYLPPDEPLTLNQLIELTNQLPEPYVIIGDFNAHSPMWGTSDSTDLKGKILEDLLTKTNTFLLNDTSPTYLIPASLKTTSVDLSMCSPDLATSLDWSTLDDTHGSDHFPIKINTAPPVIISPPQKLNFKKADWSNFTEDCKNTLNPNIETKTIEYFTEKLIEITERNIPKISTRPRKNKSWFNEECAKAVKHKKHMLRLAKKNPTNENIKIFRIAQANCRQICRSAKKKSFQKYISKINNNTPMSKIWKMIKKTKRN